jgi:hypothetical protein
MTALRAAAELDSTALRTRERLSAGLPAELKPDRIYGYVRDDVTGDLVVVDIGPRFARAQQAEHSRYQRLSWESGAEWLAV